MEKKIFQINQIYISEELELSSISFSHKVILGNTIGPLLRRVKLSKLEKKILILNKKFCELVLLIFVDYSSLNSYYGQLCDIAVKRTTKIPFENKLFFKLVKEFTSFLNDESKIFDFDSKLIHYELHPILISRIVATLLLRNQQNKHEKEKLIEIIIEKTKRNTAYSMDYLFEIKIALLLNKDFEYIRTLSKIWKNEIIKKNYHYSHIQGNYLCELAFNIKIGKKEKIKSLISKIDKSKWNSSYYDFFDFYLTIFLYHTSSKNKKSELLKKYFKICEKLDYSKFDKTYLLDFFK